MYHIAWEKAETTAGNDEAILEVTANLNVFSSMAYQKIWKWEDWPKGGEQGEQFFWISRVYSVRLRSDTVLSAPRS